MEKRLCEKLSYAFQCDKDLIIFENGKYLIPCSFSFPDDWAFEEYEVDQQKIGNEMFWIV